MEDICVLEAINLFETLETQAEWPNRVDECAQKMFERCPTADEVVVTRFRFECVHRGAISSWDHKRPRKLEERIIRRSAEALCA